VKRGVVFLAALLLTPPQAEAAPALSPLFTDRMVLQRDQQVPVWGTAATNEIITVTFTDQSKTVGVDTNGRWRVRLDPMPASREPRELRVTSSRGREEIVLRDVLVGDVWLAGGQSNMGSRMKEYLPTVAPEIPQANYPLFRVFTVPQRKVLSESMPSAAWRTVTPDTVPDVSATAYFFGRDLQRHLRVPIGIVVCAWGGTLAENWIDRELLLGHPETKPIVERYDAAVAAYGGDANYQSRLADWQRILAEWKEKRRAEGKAGPRTKEPMGPEHFQRPSGLYETMFKTMPPFVRVQGGDLLPGRKQRGRWTQLPIPSSASDAGQQLATRSRTRVAIPRGATARHQGSAGG
jgi:sialate O-acetylesterase